MRRKRTTKPINYPLMSSYPPAKPREELSREEISKIIPAHIFATYFRFKEPSHQECNFFNEDLSSNHDYLLEGIGDLDFSFIDEVENGISLDDSPKPSPIQSEYLKPSHCPALNQDKPRQVFLDPREIPTDDDFDLSDDDDSDEY
jgi:hypothetical protein